MITGSLCLTLILMSPKPCSSNSDASQRALSTSASGVALPYLAMKRLSSDPALTPIRMGTPAAPAALATSATRPSNSLMLPGFTRTAAGVDRGEDVFVLEVDIGDHRDLAVPGDLGQRVGVLLSRARHADDVAAGRGQLGDLLQRRVD